MPCNLILFIPVVNGNIHSEEGHTISQRFTARLCQLSATKSQAHCRSSAIVTLTNSGRFALMQLCAASVPVVSRRASLGYLRRSPIAPLARRIVDREEEVDGKGQKDCSLVRLERPLHARFHYGHHRKFAEFVR